MQIVLLVVKIAAYTWVLKVIFSQTYNFIFILWVRPITWIFTVATFGLVHMVAASSLGLDPRLVLSAVLIMFFLSWRPQTSRSEAKATNNKLVDEIYEEMGIKRGARKYRLGLAAFAAFSLVGYVLMFSELCDSEGKCVSI